MRLSAIFSLILVAATGFATFGVKYEVEGLLAHLARLESERAADQNQIPVLRAEWNYLNRPDTLAALNERYLSLVPVTAKQLDAQIADIPMRETAVPVAAAAPPAAPALADAGTAPEAGRPAKVKTIGELVASLTLAR